MSENPRDPFGGCGMCMHWAMEADLHRRLAEVERKFGEEGVRLEREWGRMDRWIWASMGVMVALPVGAFLGKGDCAGAARMLAWNVGGWFLGVGIARGQRWLSKRRKATQWAKLR